MAERMFWKLRSLIKWKRRKERTTLANIVPMPTDKQKERRNSYLKREMDESLCWHKFSCTSCNFTGINLNKTLISGQNILAKLAPFSLKRGEKHWPIEKRAFQNSTLHLIWSGLHLMSTLHLMFMWIKWKKVACCYRQVAGRRWYSNPHVWRYLGRDKFVCRWCLPSVSTLYWWEPIVWYSPAVYSCG